MRRDPGAEYARWRMPSKETGRWRTVRPEPVEGLVAEALRDEGFDKLSPNGVVENRSP